MEPDLIVVASMVSMDRVVVNVQVLSVVASDGNVSVMVSVCNIIINTSAFIIKYIFIHPHFIFIITHCNVLKTAFAFSARVIKY